MKNIYKNEMPITNYRTNLFRIDVIVLTKKNLLKILQISKQNVKITRKITLD